MASDKVKILYSHGGKILPLSPNRLSYVGGQTKLFSLDRRSATLPLLLSRLPSSPPSFSLKYQLPGLDVDSLISLVDHHDFLHMLYEYDCACSASDSTTKSPRLRLFLFPVDTEFPIASFNPDYLFGLDDVSGAANSVGSDTFPIEEGGETIEDLMSGNYRDRGVNSKQPAEPVAAMVLEPVRVTVPMQTTAEYYQTTTMQTVTGQIGNAYYHAKAAPFGYYDGGRYQSVQLKAVAGDVGYQYNPPQVIGYDGASSQRLYYMLPQQGYPVGIDVTGGGLRSEAKGISLLPLPPASAV